MSININNNTNQVNTESNIFNGKNKASTKKIAQKNISSNSVNQTIVTISKESRDSYRKQVQEGNTQKTTYENIKKIRSSIKEASKSIQTDYNYQLAKETSILKEQRKNNGTYNVSNRAEDYVKAYGNLYDQIVKGYKNGTIEHYVEDKNSETGYRKLTMEEELSKLDEAYKKASELVDIFAENAKKAAPAFRNMAEKMSKINSSIANSYKNKSQTDDIPDNIGTKMITVAQKWKDTYRVYGSKTNSMESITSMIKNTLYINKNL